MATYWYTGTADSKTVSAAEWTALGATGQGISVWSVANAWGIDESTLNAGSKTWLNGQSDFTLAGVDPLLAVRPNNFQQSTDTSPQYLNTTRGDARYEKIVESVNVVAVSGAAQTLPDAPPNTLHLVTLSANCTFTLPAAAAGKNFKVQINQGASAFTATFTGVKWATAYVVSTGAGARDLLEFICVDGTNWLGVTLGKAFA